MSEVFRNGSATRPTIWLCTDALPLPRAAAIKPEASYSVTAGGTRKGRAARLYRFPLMGGFRNDKAGAQKYGAFCKARGMLPVGCGSYGGCDKPGSAFVAALGGGCLAIPSAWNCYIARKGSHNELPYQTGWSSVLVATNPSYDPTTRSDKWGVYLSTDLLNDSDQKSLGPALRVHPVCGKLA